MFNLLAKDKIKEKCRNYFDVFLDILFPIECLGCGREKFWLCPDCNNKINFNVLQMCSSCKKVNKFGITCEECKTDTFLDGLLSAVSYEDKLVAKLIKTFKYSFVKDISKNLSGIFISFLQNMIIDTKEADLPQVLKNLNQHIIMPVPLHIKRKRWRGFNQSEELAKVISEYFNTQINLDSLIRTKNKSPQAKLKGAERRMNVKGCFRVKNNDLVKDKIIILIDDVVTTASTLDECAKVLKLAGAKEVWGWTVARG